MRSSSTTPIAPFTRTSLTPGRPRQGASPRSSARRDVGHLPQARLALEQVERGIGGGAGERIRHVGRPVHQRMHGVVRPERVEHRSACDGRGERQRAAGQRLRQRDDVGHDAGGLAGEQRPGAAEAGEDLVEDQQQVVAVGRRAQPRSTAASWNRMPPAPCTSGSTMMPASSSAWRSSMRSNARALLVLRQIDDVMLGQKAAERARACRPPGSHTAIAPVVSP